MFSLETADASLRSARQGNPHARPGDPQASVRSPKVICKFNGSLPRIQGKEFKERLAIVALKFYKIFALPLLRFRRDGERSRLSRPEVRELQLRAITLHLFLLDICVRLR